MELVEKLRQARLERAVILATALLATKNWSIETVAYDAARLERDIEKAVDNVSAERR